ncbi:type II toxin-antitoxin system prevent-host-death family antitoxin [Cyanobium sp. WAJ14-Wanaka]|uniref:type II toxin-antitoxin system prevent-host-death family antitoxin n=1 Tax=Cyanobium sp. WAJ14-Wanaka TaxID=2823725 RepID=UPI0020CC4DA2|nr:type II toxin-antitoxin system prevent-host-death family antitoxin [Cyanobium sp. WAJ14-Wanaka]MCP9775690.1 type II toxin-antitoxin system prevent-host-death family antitoxin [Cyanobium sp. WAJ14-Wanaka]
MKAALAGEEVNIASHGKAQVKLVPCATAVGLTRPAALGDWAANLAQDQVDAAFTKAMDKEVAELFGC